MKFKQKTNLSRGSSILEVLIAMAVLTFGISAATMVVFGNQSLEVDNETNSEALYKAKSQLEEARANSRFDFNLVNGASTVEMSGPLAYTKSLSVEMEDFFTKRVVSTVSWTEGGRTLSISLPTILTNPSAVHGGDTCGSVLTGDWMNPLLTYYEFGKQILGDESSGFPVTSIQTFMNKMYVTVNNTKGNNDETFFILDISDAPDLNSSHVLGKLDNSPETGGDISEGLNAVAVNGVNFAFVANAYDSAPADCAEGDDCAQLQIIDISNPNSPNVVKNFKIDSVAQSGDLANGTSIYYKNNVVYLGLAKADGYTSGTVSYPNGPEFLTIDVSTPNSPSILDSREIGNGINSILVKGNYAYVTSPNTQELMIFDVSNPSNIQPAGNFNSSTGAGNGKSLYIVGNKLYLGKTVPNAGNDFHILNNSNPSVALPIIGGLNSAESINGLLIRDFLAFLITNTEFQTWNISDTNNIVQYASPLNLPPGSGGVQGTATDCEGNYIFVGSQKTAPGQGGQDKGYISIITSSP